MVDANLRPVVTVMLESYFNLRLGLGQTSFTTLRRTAALDRLQTITHLLLDLEKAEL